MWKKDDLCGHLFLFDTCLCPFHHMLYWKEGIIMKQGQRIHRRIAKRRCGRNKPPAFYRFFYRFSMLIMIGLVAMLGYGISVKQGFVTGEDLLAVGTWFPFEKWFSLQDETVSAMPAYALLKRSLLLQWQQSGAGDRRWSGTKRRKARSALRDLSKAG